MISESKSQVICGCENVSLGRTASLSVKILFNRQIFRASQFHSWGGCCFRLTSASCAYFWNKNSFPRSCSSRYCASSVSGHRCRYGTGHMAMANWHVACARQFYWSTENLLDAWLCILLMHRKFTGCMAVRIRAWYTCLARRKQLVSKKKSMLLSQSDCRNSSTHFIIQFEMQIYFFYGLIRFTHVMSKSMIWRLALLVFDRFLAHPVRRTRWAYAMVWRPASVRPCFRPQFSKCFFFVISQPILILIVSY